MELAEEINDWLQECSQIPLAEIAVQLQVGSELIATVLEPRLRTLVKGRLEGGQLYTPAYVSRVNAMVCGASRGITIPTNLSAVWSSLQMLLQEMDGASDATVESSFFETLFNGLVKDGLYDCSKGICRFFLFTAFSSTLIWSRSPEGIPLESIFVHPSTVEMLDAAAEDAIERKSWIDSLSVLPAFFASQDASWILSLCRSAQVAVKSNKALILDESYDFSMGFVKVTEGGSGGTGGSGGGGGYVPNSKDGCCHVGEDRIWEVSFLPLRRFVEGLMERANETCFVCMMYSFLSSVVYGVIDEKLLLLQPTEHPRLQDAKKAPNVPLGDSLKARLKQFSVMNKLKKRALRVIAEHLSVEEVATNKRGKINLEELRVGVQKVGHQIPDADLQILMEALANDEHLHKAFAFFDLKKSGYIDLEELRAALIGEDDSNSDEVINAIMHDVDTDKFDVSLVNAATITWVIDDDPSLTYIYCHVIYMYDHTLLDWRISDDEFAAMMKAGTDWRKASKQYSRERFKSLVRDGSLQLTNESIASHIIKVHASAGATTGDTRVSKEDNWLKSHETVVDRLLHKRLKELLNHAVDGRAECQREHSTCDACRGCCHGKEHKIDESHCSGRHDGKLFTKSGLHQDDPQNVYNDHAHHHHVYRKPRDRSLRQSRKKEDHEGKTQEKQ
ncbi:hypothetical protein RHMOL_Rhmol01G0135800 [Rhododendron molle]|uniref:Uncharacterized protein n=1 Tax=Rhododendron molle TaxID=49168 RepID=A0ACC0Q1P9_RHOML|nr:hypothetical protein RHMOL_Rhmol01G0135800 [Rhododendron molle]